jgi:transketolase
VFVGQNLLEIAQSTRTKVLKVAKLAHKGHIGSGLSICEIVVAILASSNGVGSTKNDRTRIVLSKGHAALAYYAVLSEFGIISDDELNSYCVNGTKFGTHPDSIQTGTDFMTGSLGQGIGFGVGCAMAAKLQKRQGQTYVVLSDSELNEGSTWESLFIAGQNNLKSLVVILDLNGQQAMGKTKDVLRLDGLPNQLGMVGWNCLSMDGHDVENMALACSRKLDDGSKPLLVIAKTIAGKGVSFMEGKVEWHYMPQTDDQHRQALEEVGKLLQAARAR